MWQAHLALFISDRHSVLSLKRNLWAEAKFIHLTFSRLSLCDVLRWQPLPVMPSWRSVSLLVLCLRPCCEALMWSYQVWQVRLDSGFDKAEPTRLSNVVLTAAGCASHLLASQHLDFFAPCNAVCIVCFVFCFFRENEWASLLVPSVQ